MVPVEREEQVPVERIEYITREYDEQVPVERVEMVPVQVQDMVSVQKTIQNPIERQEEIVEYVAVTRSIVHHHMADGTVQDMRMSQLPAGANVVSENRDGISHRGNHMMNQNQIVGGNQGYSQNFPNGHSHVNVGAQSSKPSMKSVNDLVGGPI